MRELVASYDRVSAEGRPELVALVAAPGWGKTRIIQELYEELASSRQGAPRYWPPSILSDNAAALRTRKRTYPQKFTIPPGARPGYFWWGILCGRDSSGKPLSALRAEHDQLQAHLAGLLTKAMDQRSTARRRIEMLGSAFSLLGLPDPIGIALEVADLAPDAIEELREIRERILRGRREVEARTIDLRVPDDSRLVDDLAHALAEIAGDDLPIVWVIDDAQFADPTLVTLLKRLLELPTGRILCVSTAWPHELVANGPEGDETFGALLRDASAASPDRVNRIDLNLLSNEDLALMARSFAPRSSAAVIDSLVERADGNPLVLRLLLDLPRVQDALRDGALELSPAEISALPREVALLYQDIWTGMPIATRRALSLASLHGRRLLPLLMIAGHEREGSEDLRAALADAEERYGWLRAASDSVREFTERSLFEVARASLPDLFSAAELTRAREAAFDAMAAARQAPGWQLLPALQRRVMLEGQVSLAEAVPGQLAESASAAHQLASLDRDEGDYLAWQRRAELSVRLKRQANPSSQTLLEYEMDLARAYNLAGEHGLAEELGERMLEDCGRMSGADALLAAAVEQNLAMSYRLSGRLDDAVRAAERAFGSLGNLLGRQHPRTIEAQGELAQAYRAAGQLSKAVEAGAAVLSARQALLGEDHPETAMARNNLGAIYRDAGELDAALALGASALEHQERRWGESHPNTLMAKTNLAVYYDAAGRYRDAIKLSEEVFEARLANFGERHPLTLREQGNLACYYEAGGQLEEAVALHEQNLAAREDLLGPSHPDTINSRANLADALREHGPVERAVKLDEEALKLRIEKLGPDHHDTIHSRLGLSRSLYAAGDFDGALREGREAVRLQEDFLGPSHPRTIRGRLHVGRCLLAVGQDAEAEALLEAALEQARARLGADHPVVEEAETLLSERP